MRQQHQVLAVEVYVKAGRLDRIGVKLNTPSPFPNSQEPLWLTFKAPEGTGVQYAQTHFDCNPDVHVE